MQYPYEYSEAEKRLIATLKMEQVAMNLATAPPLLYIFMAVACFRENRMDDVSTSVRNCLKALDTPFSIVRGTPEFDQLILI